MIEDIPPGTIVNVDLLGPGESFRVAERFLTLVAYPQSIYTLLTAYAAKGFRIQRDPDNGTYTLTKPRERF